MYPLILVPLDGSPFAEGALPIAAMVSERHQAPLHLVAVHTVLARPLSLPDAPVYDSQLDDDRRSQLDNYLAQAAAKLTGELGREVTYATVSDDTSTAGAIVKEAERRGAGLVELLRTMPVPTLVVRDPAADAAGTVAPSLTKVLLPLDGSELASAALEPALALVAPFGATFTVLRVVRTAESQLPYDQTFWTAAEQQVMEELRADAQRDVDRVVTGLRARGLGAEGLVVLESDAARTILSVAAERDVGLIAMSTSGRGGLARLLVGSVTDKVVRGADHPVLVVRPEQQQ